MAGRLKVGLKGDVHVAKIARGSHFAVRGWMVYCLLAGSSLTLAACGRQGTEPQEATRQTKVVASLKLKEPKDHQDSRSLAYEHTVSIELPKDLISARINDVRVACDSRKEFACTLLDVSVQGVIHITAGRRAGSHTLHSSNSDCESAAPGEQEACRSRGRPDPR